MKPFNFKRKLQGFPVPRAETQYPHRPDKHQLSEDNALAFHASAYPGKKKKKSALGKTCASSTIINESGQATDLFIGMGALSPTPVYCI